MEYYKKKNLKIPKGYSESYIEKEQTTQWSKEKKYKRTTCLRRVVLDTTNREIWLPRKKILKQYLFYGILSALKILNKRQRQPSSKNNRHRQQ